MLRNILHIYDLMQILSLLLLEIRMRYAAVAKSADARDLKSLGRNAIPVQVRSAAPTSLVKKDAMRLKPHGIAICGGFAPSFFTLWFERYI